ncbi:MAG TPA: hypothetical protein VK673_01240, partial [Chthoniobacterales bacterium]|nr:hypothetical protein [Chthoniobacterales bacterium]
HTLLDRAGFEPRHVVGFAPNVLYSGPARKFESVSLRDGFGSRTIVADAPLQVNGSNPARTPVTSMACPRRAEIIALPALRADHSPIRRLAISPIRHFALSALHHASVWNLTNRVSFSSD